MNARRFCLVVLVLLILASASAVAAVSVTSSATPQTVIAGHAITYTFVVTNNGREPVRSVTFSALLPRGWTAGSSLAAPGAWVCPIPPSGGEVLCTHESLPVGNSVITIRETVDPTTPHATLLSSICRVKWAEMGMQHFSMDHLKTAVVTSADLSITKVDTPDPVNAGNAITYTVTVTNAGPSSADSVTLTDAIPAGTTFSFLAAPGAWVCPVRPAGGRLVCTHASLPVGTSVFTIKAIVDSATAAGTVLTNTATVSSATGDPNRGNESASATTTVARPAGT